MQNAIILHGRPGRDEYYDPLAPSASNAHWLPWLQNQLLANNIAASTPEVPLAYEPLWERWVEEVERFDINENTILVGHSCGAGFWIRYLSEHKDIRVGKVILVAPWIDVEQDDPHRFFDFSIDKNLASRTAGLTIFHSDNDKAPVQTSLAKLKSETADLHVKVFHDYGHFTSKHMQTNAFPELLTEILS
ncbi:putative hydrolase YdeN [compost metagenome]